MKIQLSILFYSIFLLNVVTSAETNDASVYDPECGEGKYILTPEASPKPVINGASFFGVRPGSPFLYTIPTTGVKPIHFKVRALPDGLELDEKNGLISGKIKDLSPREYEVKFVASNNYGNDTKAFTIKVGEKICLTPPLGWNSWNCWRGNVTQQNVVDSAHAVVNKGLKDYGWTYINIDDAWQGIRGGKYNSILGNEKFPDIKAMCDEIHGLGLKVGIYSSPWITTYAGFVGGSSDDQSGKWDESMGTKEVRKEKTYWKVGNYTFDDKDAAQWAAWGIDYLKYDWNPNDPESTLRMANALRNSGRDILYSLSNSAPIEHAELFAKVVHCWRTTGDLDDRWDQPGRHRNILQGWAGHRHWIENGSRGGPGHFPDADMLVVGDVIMNSGGKSTPFPSRLTPDEQYSHITLWVLWNCPLLIGCPVETMDEFTVNLLANSEVLDVHQDELAKSGVSYDIAEGIEIIIKDLADGSKAVGLFNKNETAQVVTIDWSLIGLKGSKTVRDIWRQKTLGEFKDSFRANVRSHGVVFVKIED